MRFSIVTPSFRSSHWLKLNLPSVADQEVDHEHLVQDSCSDDGTMDWLAKDQRVSAYFEKDRGMYDAVNRGLKRARGELLAYLNCDEQYLPGALAQVSRYFDENRGVDVCFADAVVVDPEGNYLCHRGAMIPTRGHTLVSRGLAILTCATFFRRSVLEERGLYFDERLRDLGDAEWVLRLIGAGVTMGVLRHFTSAFTETGENMNLKPNAKREQAEMYDSAPGWARWLRPAIIARYRVAKLFSGDYHRAPFHYEIYTAQSPERRVRFEAARPTGVWTRSELQAPGRPDAA
ncbi:MAG TPA: glycosyltransferase [Candidatus Dormibacteraeota bacterium]|nr:glycosyltransferase [Candidatus Dormibacteraeota bacterium]